MARSSSKLTSRELKRLNCPVNCELSDQKINDLADYLATVSAMLDTRETYWSRGHANIMWTLTPSALRIQDVDQREAALRLLSDFKRRAEFKLRRPPAAKDGLQWMQIAQHFGIPTRLLDWTESAIFALYFACLSSNGKNDESDGVVFVFNPRHLSRLPGGSRISSLDDPLPEKLIDRYIRLGARKRTRGLPTIAINPVWNSERLMMQRGAFTLHGSPIYEIDKEQAPSLVGLPILKDSKPRLRSELDRIGIDEITMFPELEHICKTLKRRAGLT